MDLLHYNAVRLPILSITIYWAIFLLYSFFIPFWAPEEPSCLRTNSCATIWTFGLVRHCFEALCSKLLIPKLGKCIVPNTSSVLVITEWFSVKWILFYWQNLICSPLFQLSILLLLAILHLIYRLLFYLPCCNVKTIKYCLFRTASVLHTIVAEW